MESVKDRIDIVNSDDSFRVINFFGNNSISYDLYNIIAGITLDNEQLLIMERIFSRVIRQKIERLLDEISEE